MLITGCARVVASVSHKHLANAILRLPGAVACKICAHIAVSMWTCCTVWWSMVGAASLLDEHHGGRHQIRSAKAPPCASMQLQLRASSSTRLPCSTCSKISAWLSKQYEVRASCQLLHSLLDKQTCAPAVAKHTLYSSKAEASWTGNPRCQQVDILFEL